MSMANLGVSGATSDEMLSILRTSGASCEPEVKELMHQLDMFISAKCSQWEEQVATLRKLLEKKEEEVQLLQVALQEEKSQEEQLKEAANKREKEYRAHSADCEAQLVRLRSQVTRLSRSFEHLKGKRHQERQGNSTTQLSEMKEELERTELNLHHSNEELKKVLARLTERKHEEGNEQFEVQQGSEKGKATERMLKKITNDVEKKVLEDRDGAVYIPLEPTSTPPHKVLTQLLDKHFVQLNDELLKVLKHN